MNIESTLQQMTKPEFVAFHMLALREHVAAMDAFERWIIQQERQRLHRRIRLSTECDQGGERIAI